MKKFFFLLVLLGTLSVGCTKDMLDGLKDIIGNPDYEQPNIVDISVPNNQIWYTNGSTTERTKPYNSDVFGANIVSNTFDAKKGCWVIKFDGDVTTIGEMAFSYSRLTSVAIPDSVTEIGVQACYYCSSLTSVTIPDSVTEIGVQAFYKCSSLTSITIGDSVTTIGDSAFRYCSSLTSVYCKALTPPAGGSNMFGSSASDRKIYVPTESVEAYKSASYWKNYADAIVGYDF